MQLKHACSVHGVVEHKIPVAGYDISLHTLNYFFKYMLDTSVIGVFSASHEKSLEIQMVNTPGLCNDSAWRRGLSRFAQKSYVLRLVVTSITMRCR